MKPLRAALAALLCYASVLPAGAFINPALQMLTGNPSAAATDPANHEHYLIQRAQYALDYSDTLQEPNWVSWNLTTDDIGGSGRSSDFFVDTTLPAGFTLVQTNAYSGSGYDRGHMTPSGDRTVSRADNDVTFYMSNMVPQTPDNNQGVWANFESYCRTLAGAGNEILIISGPGGFGGSRLASGVAVPGFTWKIAVVVPLGPGSAISRLTSTTRVIALKVPNVAGVRSTPWQNFVTSAAQLQADTGYTFFTDPGIPASVASALRAAVDGQAPTGAPAISSHPTTQTTVVGGSATFSVAASGDAPLTYQWLKDDDEIPGATSSILNLTNVQAADAATYAVVVSNSVASVTSNAASLVIMGMPPTIATPPASQTVNAGSNVLFSVAATGSPTLTYQWRKGGLPLGGATTATLALANVQAGDNGTYDVVVTNSVNSATSAGATLNVLPAAPSITTQPAPKSASTGSNASFTVVATGTAPLSYQWRKAGTPLADGGVVAGATTATLLLTGISAVDAGSYDVVVTNSVSSVTSNAAALTVSAPPPSTMAWTFGPSGAATADPTTPVADISGGTFSHGNNTGAPPLLSTTSASSGYAEVSGANNAGAAARIGALNKTPGTGSAYFEFTLDPADGKRLLVSGIRFGMRSTSTGPQAYSIFTSLDGFATPVSTGAITANSSWTLHTPSFPTLTGATGEAVTFRIYGHNGAGSAGTGTVNWRIDDVRLTVTTVFPPPVAPVVVSTAPANAATAVAVTTPITVTFNEAVSFTGAWFSLSSALHGPLAAAVSGGPTSFTLTPPANFAYNDTISVTIFGAKVVDQATGTIPGTSNTTVSFTTAAYVPPTPPSFTAQPEAQTVNAGTNVSFSVAVAGTAPFTYQWRFNGTPITGNASATTATLTLTSVPTTAAGNYDCVVTNVAGNNVSATAALVVNVVAPSIATQPAAQMAAVGGTATFTVAANGTGPLAYQWRRNGAPLADGPNVAGALTASVTLSGLSATDTASYDVVVTNAGGSVPSASALLAVTQAMPGVVTWDFATATPTSGLPAGVTGGQVKQGNNNGTTTLLTAISVSSGYSGASGGNNAGAAARVLSPTNTFNASLNAYFEFEFAPPAGRQFAATAISFGMRSTGTGPQAFALYSDADNFAAPIATGTVPNNSAWVRHTPAFKGTVGASGAPVKFRLYGFNGSGSPGTNTANWRIDDLKLTAGVLAVPAIAPAVVATSPAAGATHVALAAPITLTFNQEVNVSGSWFAVSSLAHGPLAFAVSGGPTTFTLTPTAAYAYGDTITLTLNGAQIKEAATDTLTLPGSPAFSFTTIPPVPPSITAPPIAQTVTVGDNVSFSVVAAGTAPLAYQWMRNGSAIIGATDATYALNAVTTAAAGDYSVVVSNIAGSAASTPVTLTVNKAVASVELAALTATYDGAPHAVSVTTQPAGVGLIVTYDGSTAAPVNAGSYAVLATVDDPNYLGSASGTLVIQPAEATLTLAGLTQAYDGLPKVVTVTTAPADLPVSVTYDGAATPPTVPGAYAIAATVTDPNYRGNVTGTLLVSITAIVRHAPTIDGGLDGSLQMLRPENIRLNGNAWISGDLLVPGLPAVQLNGTATLVGTREATGAATPTDYAVTLNGGATLRYIVRRTDALELPTVLPPPAPTGTRSVMVNSANQRNLDLVDVADVTLNGNAGAVALPPGNFGSLVANGGSALVLGVAGATEPAVYNVQRLTLNGNSRVQIVGPVILTLAESTALNSSLGEPAHPEWLTLRIARGDLTLNGHVTLHGFVIAPQGTVTIGGHSTIKGGVTSDGLNIQGNGQLEAVAP